MIVEYIIDKDEYKKKLTAVNFTASNSKEVAKRNFRAHGKNNYFLKLSCTGSDKNTARALSEVSLNVEEMFRRNDVNFRLLTNEAAQFFVKELYPSVCEFETKLRKFVHSTLFDVNEEAKVKVEARIKAAFEKKQIKEKLLNIDFLEQGSLEEIIAFLFANDDLYGDLKSYTSDRSNRFCTRQDLLNFIQKSEKHTIWETFFAKEFSDSKLPTIFRGIIDCRNDVMHFHNINYERYLECKDLLKSGIDDLNKQIKKGIVIEDSSDNIAKLSENFGYVQGILKPLMTLNSTTEKLIASIYTPAYLDSISRITETLSRFSKIQMPDVLQSFQNFTFSNTLSELKASLASATEEESTSTQKVDKQITTGETKDGE